VLVTFSGVAINYNDVAGWISCNLYVNGTLITQAQVNASNPTPVSLSGGATAPAGTDNSIGVGCTSDTGGVMGPISLTALIVPN
jgi:hypothetical protein